MKRLTRIIVVMLLVGLLLGCTSVQKQETFKEDPFNVVKTGVGVGTVFAVSSAWLYYTIENIRGDRKF